MTGWCFTINNPKEDEVEALKQLDYAYLVLGYEKGEQGTFHIQGYIHYKRNVVFSRVKQDLPRAHIEARKGSVLQAVNYCKKDGVFQEFGTCPKTAQDASRETWKNIMECAQKGDHEWIMENYPKVWIQLSNRLEGLRKREKTILDGELQHEWWVGPTGSGKSSTLWQEYGNHYQKELNKWWCGYQDEIVVAVEEWSPKNECTGSQLKIWADRYPFTAQIKGGSIKGVRPLKIIVLSNFDIDACFTDARDLDPLRRRFKTYRFPDDIDEVVQRARDFKHRHPAPQPEPVASLPIPTRSEETRSPIIQDCELDAGDVDFAHTSDDELLVDEHAILKYLDL